MIHYGKFAGAKQCTLIVGGEARVGVGGTGRLDFSGCRVVEQGEWGTTFGVRRQAGADVGASRR